MRFKCFKTKIEMKLCLIVAHFALTIACTYAGSITSSAVRNISSSSSSNDISEQHRPAKHRTARLVREFPPNIGQRLQTIEYPSYNIPNPYGPGTYAFGYEIEDPQTGNVQFRDEEKLQNGTVRGSYGYMQLDGSVVITRFYADLFGYHAHTEIRQADGQLVSSLPGKSPTFSASVNRNPLNNIPATYNPALNADYIDPQYSAAIIGHIKNQQYSPSQGLMQYPNGIPPTQPFPVQDAPLPPMGMIPYQAPPANENFFSNFVTNLRPSNWYNNLQSTFPNIVPQQNPLNTLATNVQNGFQQFTQNNPFGNFVGNAQSQLQQWIPQNNPLAGWFNGNRLGQQQQQQQQQQQLQQLQQQQQLQLQQQQQQLFTQQQQQQLFPQQQPGAGLTLGDTGLTSGYLNGLRIPTTKRRRIIATTKRRKHGLKTRNGADDDWLDEFLESRKREMIYGMTTTPKTASTAAVPIKESKVPA